MTYFRMGVAVVAVLVWVLSAPLAMASDNCMAMGAMCEGPCGAGSCVVSQHVDGRAFHQIAAEVISAADHAVTAALPAPDLPPKLLTLSF
jgi:hypothetical protein